MTTAPVTVVDRIAFTCSVSPEQAAAYCRRHPRLAGWEEARAANERGVVIFYRFGNGGRWRGDRVWVDVPARASSPDYSRRMAELCDALVALGCGERPSEILMGMGEERL